MLASMRHRALSVRWRSCQGVLPDCRICLSGYRVLPLLLAVVPHDDSLMKAGMRHHATTMTLREMGTRLCCGASVWKPPLCCKLTLQPSGYTLRAQKPFCSKPPWLPHEWVMTHHLLLSGVSKSDGKIPARDPRLSAVAQGSSENQNANQHTLFHSHSGFLEQA